MEDFGGSGSPNVSKTGLVKVTNLKTSAASKQGETNHEDEADTTEIDTDNADDDNTTTALAAKVAIIALNELPDGKHATTEDFTAWLGDRKSRWSAQRAARKAHRAELAKYGNKGTSGSNSAVPYNKKNVGVADFVRNASLAASQGFWQVRGMLLCSLY